eukprot:444559-Rhodomonas_salina.2
MSYRIVVRHVPVLAWGSCGTGRSVLSEGMLVPQDYSSTEPGYCGTRIVAGALFGRSLRTLPRACTAYGYAPSPRALAHGTAWYVLRPERATRSPVLSWRMLLRACYAKSGTELAYARRQKASQARSYDISDSAMLSPTTYIMVLCLDPITYPISLRACYAVSGTDIACYATPGTDMMVPRHVRC